MQMKGLIIFPGCKPKEIALDKGLKPLQSAVEGYIEVIYPFDDPVALICNEEGKFNGSIPNRALYDANGKLYDIICGTFLVVGIGEEEFADLSDELLKKYKEHFARPEIFVKNEAGEIEVIYTDEL